MKRWFQRRLPREQGLVVVFAVLGALIWLSVANGRLRAQLSDWRASDSELTAQQLWLDRQQAITTQAATAVRNLEPARTYDATRLVTTVTSLAGAAGLAPAIDPPVTQRTSQFAYHQIRVSFQRASLGALLKFSDELARQAPYLSLEQIALQADRAAADTLSVTLLISATQIETATP